jgi:hypothetical protein
LGLLPVTAGAGFEISIPADPGDVFEIDLNALWDAPASTIAGKLDIVTINEPQRAGAASTGNAALTYVIHYVSGCLAVGANYGGLGYNQVGAQATNGLTSLLSQGLSSGATFFQDKAVGRFNYTVQPSDIIDGYVYVGLVGLSGSTTNRGLQTTAGNLAILSVKNTGPASLYAEA